MVKPKPPRGHVEARLKDPLLIEGLDSRSAALHKVTETLAAHSIHIDKVLQALLDTKTSLEGKIDDCALNTKS
ncbi:hypothetical protein NDU88_004360 [Pleurodeles waltl]|uniref:Uncharacterized protein n=1 Tax=Pleurodeles waltl TaxID=8319 RepID=A0AAV7TTB1_PLEWA|nr:hypothetical protein NDU88_004360 [Pleurodeles waltl]